MSERDELWNALGIARARISREEFEQYMNVHDHALATRQRNWDAEAEGYTDPQMAVYAVADLIDPEVDDDVSPANPDEKPAPDGDHDFQWGDDNVQRCTRCRLPHSQWAGGPCPGPSRPFKTGDYV